MTPEISAGDRQSHVLSLASADQQALRRLVEELGGGFRKICFDLAAGFVEFMAPSQEHEFTSRDARDLVLVLCRVRGLEVVDMGATTIGVPDGTRSVVPDESFLIGERAAEYRRLEAAAGAAAAMASIRGQPPDLAIEVEHTSHQPEKVDVYRRCGVGELWDLASEAKGRAPRIYDLTGKAARPRETSRLLPGIRAARLPAAAEALRAIGGPISYAEQRARGEPVDRRLLDIVASSDRPPSP